MDQSQFPRDLEDIAKIFEAMNQVVGIELTRLIEKQRAQEQEEQKGPEYGDVFTDFNTEEFINKNVRVRPVSGVTHGDETKDGRQSSISKAAIQNEVIDEGEDNYNKFAILELEDQRKTIKDQHKKMMEEVARKQALLAKEAEAKKNK